MTPTPVHFGRKPTRPKRPLTPYITFMKKFLRAQCIKSKKEAQTAVKAGAKRWNKMSDAERAKFGKHCAKGRMIYKLEKAEYLRQLKALKQPARPYGAFLSNYLKECGSSSNNKSIIEMNDEIASAWHNLPHSERDKYRNEFYQQYDDFCRRIEEQRNNSGEFVAAERPSISPNSNSSVSGAPAATINSFDLRKQRRERCRLLLQQKLEREQKRESLITSNSSGRNKIEGTGSFIMEQDNGSTSTNKTASISGAGPSNEKQGAGSSNNSASEGRTLRPRKVEARDERSSSRPGGNAKNLKLSSKAEKNSSSKAVEKNKVAKNQGEVKKRGRPTLAAIALRNKRK